MNLENTDKITDEKEYVTGHIESFWIFSKTILYTFGICVKVIMVKFIDKNQYRQVMDRILKCWGCNLMRILDTQIELKGKEHFKLEPGRAHMIMCSHTSNYDIPATFASLDGSIRMLAKKELKNIPFFGKAMQRIEMVFIDRQNKANAISDLNAAKRVMEDGIVLWVAPEGTRTIGAKKLGKLKKGGFHLAVSTDAIIIPIGFRGINDLQLRERYAWHKHRTIECHIGKPIDSKNFPVTKINNLLVEVRQSLETLIGVNEV